MGDYLKLFSRNEEVQSRRTPLKSSGLTLTKSVYLTKPICGTPFKFSVNQEGFLEQLNSVTSFSNIKAVILYTSNVNKTPKITKDQLPIL